MKVKATKLGYYDLKRRKEGVEFELVPVKGKVWDKSRQALVSKVLSPEDQFSPSWMEKVDEEPKPRRKPSAPIADAEESTQDPV